MARKQKKAKNKRLYGESPPPRRLAESLIKATSLLESEKWRDAVLELEKLNQRYPNNQDVLGMLAECYYEMGDMDRYQWTLERVVSHQKNDPDLILSLVGAYLVNGRPAHALKNLRFYLDRWPDHQMAGEAIQTVDELELALPEIVSEKDLDFEELFSLSLEHEEMVSLIAREEYAQALVSGREILRQYPDYYPALNNLSEIYWNLGKSELAIETSRQSINLNPKNIFGLANLTRYFCLVGDTQEAQEQACLLTGSLFDTLENFLKAIQGLSFFGDDSGVLELFNRALAREDFGLHPGYSGMIYHLAAVASSRLGHDEDAMNFWRKSLEILPNFELVLENLADMEKPVGERHAPWAFSLYDWLTPHQMINFDRLVKSVSKTTDEKRIERTTRQFLERNSDLLPLIPILLDRGDETGRDFAIALARMLETPELLITIKEYALGKRGPDRLRMEAGQILVRAGILPNGFTRMWVGSKWIDVLLIGIELHDEPVEGLVNQEANELLREAINSLYEQDGDSAEQKLKQALRLEPNSPILLYNLAGAYKAQGKEDEAIELIGEIHSLYPNYLFARAALSAHLSNRGDLERAKNLIKPLLHREKMHLAEFDALCGAQIEYYLAEKNRVAARAWFGLWESVAPENSKLDVYRLRVFPLKILEER